MFNITHGTTIVIVSAERPQFNHAGNAARSARLEAWLAGWVANGNAYMVWPGMGSYKGARERCFAVVAQRDDAAALALQVCRQFDQECALVIDEHQTGALVYPDGRHEAIGSVRYVADATGLEAYTTLDGHSGGWVVDTP